MFTTRPVLSGTYGMVATTHWLATAAGMAVLERGGTAADAAAAAGFVLHVVEPHLNGPGGDLPLIVGRAGSADATVLCAQGPVPAWNQPIINQPEVGILGLLVKEFDGVLHLLLQLKAEPGNCNGIQVSPTVQATRSNYTGVHGGSRVPYLDFFRDRRAHRTIVDVRQSEQGAWFLRKRNRNMVVQVSDEVELLDGFHWLTLGQVHQLLHENDTINMDTRSVLACLPVGAETGDRDGASLHSTDELLGWLTETRAATEIDVRRTSRTTARSASRSVTVRAVYACSGSASTADPACSSGSPTSPTPAARRR